MGGGRASLPAISTSRPIQRLRGKNKIMKKLFRLGDEDVPKYMANIAVKHDMTPAEREVDRELRKQAKEKSVQLNKKTSSF